MIKFYAKGSALTDLHRKVEALVFGTKVIQVSKRLARVVTNFWVVTFLLELVDHDDRNHNFLLFELEQGTWVR